MARARQKGENAKALESFSYPGLCSRSIDTPLSISISDHLTPEEREQILQTIEMFETIVAASPDDLSTLEILKEAYWKIGRLSDAIATSKHLGSLYEGLGQLSRALAEYETIQRQLVESPEECKGLDDMLVAEVELKVVELKEKLRSRHNQGASNPHAAIALDFAAEFDVAEGAPLPTSPVQKTAPPEKQDDFALGGYTTPQKQPPAPASPPSRGPTVAPLAFPEASTLFGKTSPAQQASAPPAAEPQAPATPPASSTPQAPQASPAPSAPATGSKAGAIPFKLQEPQPAGATPPSSAAPPTESPALANTLIATAATRLPNTALRVSQPLTLNDDGYEPLIKFIAQQHLVTPELLNNATEQARQFNQGEAFLARKAPAASLLYELEKAGVPIAPIVSAIIDRTKFAYIPLEFYDIDRQIVRMLSEDLTLGRLIIPFDLLGRTLMVAIDNPFDAAARNAVQQSVDYPIQWHVALPQVIQKILRSTYRLGSL